jgi:hypothetical protein
VERRVEVEMSQIINVKDLSEEEVKLVGDFIEFLKA